MSTSFTESIGDFAHRKHVQEQLSDLQQTMTREWKYQQFTPEFLEFLVIYAQQAKEEQKKAAARQSQTASSQPTPSNTPPQKPTAEASQSPYQQWKHFMTGGWGYSTGTLPELPPLSQEMQACLINQATAELRRILRDNLYKRYVPTKQGSMNFVQLAKYKTTKKVFMKPQEKQTKAYHVELLVDMSSSMFGDKMQQAVVAATYISKALGSLCDLQVTFFNAIEHSFSWKHMSLDYYEMIQSDDPKKHPEHFYTKQARSDGYGQIYSLKHLPVGINADDVYPCPGYQANFDTIALLNARDRLRKKEGKKIIIVLSDGQPCDGLSYTYGYGGKYRYDKHLPEQMKSMVTTMEKRDGISVLSFGLQTQGLEAYYNNVAYIQNATEILPTLVSKLRSVVK